MKDWTDTIIAREEGRIRERLSVLSKKNKIPFYGTPEPNEVFFLTEHLNTVYTLLTHAIYETLNLEKEQAKTYLGNVPEETSSDFAISDYLDPVKDFHEEILDILDFDSFSPINEEDDYSLAELINERVPKSSKDFYREANVILGALVDLVELIDDNDVFDPRYWIITAKIDERIPYLIGYCSAYANKLPSAITTAKQKRTRDQGNEKKLEAARLAIVEAIKRNITPEVFKTKKKWKWLTINNIIVSEFAGPKATSGYQMSSSAIRDRLVEIFPDKVHERLEAMIAASNPDDTTLTD